MEILFKDSEKYFFIKYEKLVYAFINGKHDLSNIKHLDDAEVLYNYIDERGNLYPVYYEYNGRFISSGSQGTGIFNVDNKIKDNTLINTKLLDNI